MTTKINLKVYCYNCSKELNDNNIYICRHCGEIVCNTCLYNCHGKNYCWYYEHIKRWAYLDEILNLSKEFYDSDWIETGLWLL